MNRVEDILEFKLPEGIVDSFGLENAYCACLMPQQACELLLRCAVDRTDLRRPILRKVCADIDVEYSDSHRQLINDLISTFSAHSSRGRQALGYCLSTLSSRVPAVERRVIQEFFLASKYIGVRKRGYKSAASDENPPLQAIETAWRQYADTDCAWLIVKLFSTEFLAKNRAALAKCFTEGWQLSKLHLKVSQIEPAALSELKAVDEVSYCYVMAKIGTRLSEDEAIIMLNNSLLDERLGLLVWCLGKMQLWGALKYVESILPAIQEQRMIDFSKKHGITQND